MRVGSFEPHGEPECAKFGCSTVVVPISVISHIGRCVATCLLPNGYSHYLSNMTCFDSEEIMQFTVDPRTPPTTDKRRIKLKILSFFP